MAEAQQDKTEHKSRKKFEEARDKGELPSSKEFATFVVFLVIILYFLIVRTHWFDALGSIMADLLRFDQHMHITAESVDDFLLRPLLKTMFILAPFFLIIMFVSTLTSMSQTGFSLATKKLEVNWDRMDPTKGVKKLYSLKSWVEGAKSAFKVGLFATLTYSTLRGAIPEIVEIAGRPLRDQIDFMMTLTLSIALRIALLMAAFSVVDYAFQWWQFQNTLKMTHQEVKEEAKEHEGDPLVRQRMRSLRMQMARDRMMNDVPKASVIVTNPTRYAVAIRYDRDAMAAPVVVAKGKELIALRIRELAREHGVPVVENPPIARALFKQVKVGHPVPSQFYRAIAELLAFVYLLKKKHGESGLRERRDPWKPTLQSGVGAPEPGTT